MEEDLLPGGVDAVEQLLIQGLEQPDPGVGGDEQAALGPPVVAEGHGVHVHGQPRVHIDPEELHHHVHHGEHLRLLQRDVAVEILGPPQELEPLEHADPAADEELPGLSGGGDLLGQGGLVALPLPEELLRGGRVPLHGLVVREDGVLDLAHHAGLDVGPPAAPGIRVGTHLVVLRRKAVVKGPHKGGDVQPVRVAGLQLLEGLAVGQTGRGQHPDVQRDAVAAPEGQGVQDPLPAGHW